MSSPERYVECVERYNFPKGEFYYSFKGLGGGYARRIVSIWITIRKRSQSAVDFVKAKKFFLRAAEKG
jgi:hypothetical protein